MNRTSSAFNMEEYVNNVFNIPYHTPPTIAPDQLNTIDTTKYMEVLAKQYKRIKHKMDELKKQADDIKAEMIVEMDARQLDKLQAGDYEISYIIFDKSTFDTKAFKLDHPEVYDAYIKTKAETRFTVNNKK